VPEQTGQDSAHRRPPSREMHRLTLKVPLADVDTEKWWGTQFDPSAAVRALIRAEIARNGVTDMLNRSVANQGCRVCQARTQEAATEDGQAEHADSSSEPQQTGQ